MLGLQGWVASSSGLHGTRSGLRRLRLTCESGILCCASSCLLKAVHIFPGKGSSPSSHSPHAFLGIRRFSTNFNKRNKNRPRPGSQPGVVLPHRGHVAMTFTWPLPASPAGPSAMLSFLAGLGVFYMFLSLHIVFSPLWRCPLCQFLCFSARQTLFSFKVLCKYYHLFGVSLGPPELIVSYFVLSACTW